MFSYMYDAQYVVPLSKIYTFLRMDRDVSSVVASCCCRMLLPFPPAGCTRSVPRLLHDTRHRLVSLELPRQALGEGKKKTPWKLLGIFSGGGRGKYFNRVYYLVFSGE